MICATIPVNVKNARELEWGQAFALHADLVRNVKIAGFAVTAMDMEFAGFVAG